MWSRFKWPVFLTWVAVAHAAPVVTLTGPTSVGTGGAATLTVSLSGSAGTNMAALQFTITPPSGLTMAAPVLTPAWVAAGFAITCGPTHICVVVNSKTVTPAIADGTVATIPVTISQACTPGATALPMTVIAATGPGYDANATVGTPYSITVQQAPGIPTFIATMLR